MRRLTLVFMTTLLLTASTHAQYGTSGLSDAVQATGTVELKVRPELLQMTIAVEGRSSDMPQAVEELKRRIEVAKKKLVELGASEESLTIAKPTLQGTTSPEQAQQMQMMMQQYGGGERGKQMLDQTQSVSLTQSLTARWPLSEEDDLKRLIATKTLTQKIRDADIASTADKQPVSAAQEELAVEMAAMMEEYSYGEETTKTGEPVFQFVARIPAQQYQESLSQAFVNAARQIRTLADATNAKIGNPLPVSSSIDSSAGEDYYGQSSYQEPKLDPETGDHELIANDPIEAKCIVTVTAVSKHK